MKKIEAVIRKERLDIVKKALDGINILNLIITDVLGYSNEKGYEDYYSRDFFGDRKLIKSKLNSKVKLDFLIEDDLVDFVVETIRLNALTGRHGDGKIFVLPVEQAIRLRTGEKGETVL